VNNVEYQVQYKIQEHIFDIYSKSRSNVWERTSSHVILIANRDVQDQVNQIPLQIKLQFITDLKQTFKQTFKFGN